MARASRQPAHTTVAPSPDVRRAVLDGALAIIESEGADSLSMREVARRAGVSHQAPYHYFGDRAGIFAAITEEGFTLFAERFEATLAGSDDPLASCLRTYVRFALEHKGHYRVMFRSDICGIVTHEPARVAADRAYLALLDLATKVDPERSADGDTLTLPIALWSSAHGLATLLIDGPLAAKLPPETGIDLVLDNVAHFTSRSIHDHIAS